MTFRQAYAAQLLVYFGLGIEKVLKLIQCPLHMQIIIASLLLRMSCYYSVHLERHPLMVSWVCYMHTRLASIISRDKSVDAHLSRSIHHVLKGRLGGRKLGLVAVKVCISNCVENLSLAVDQQTKQI